MSERGIQRHQTHDGQTTELVDLLSARGEEGLSLSGPGRGGPQPRTLPHFPTASNQPSQVQRCKATRGGRQQTDDHEVIGPGDGIEVSIAA